MSFGRFGCFGVDAHISYTILLVLLMHTAEACAGLQMPFHGSSDTYSMQQIAVWTVRGKSHLKTASGGVPDIRRDWGRGKFEFKLLVLLLFPWFHTGRLWHIARIRTQFIQCFVLRACLDRNFDGWRGDPSLFKVQHWTNTSCSLLVASSRALLAIAQHCVCVHVCVSKLVLSIPSCFG